MLVIASLLSSRFLLFGEVSTSVLPKKLDQIESRMYQDPVTAKSELIGLLRGNQEASDSIKAIIYQKLGTTLGMTGKLDSGIWASKESIRLFSDQCMGKAGSLKLLATLYRLQGDFKAAEIAIKKSIELNDRLWKDNYLKAITLQEYASLCLDQYDYLKATSLYLEALRITTSPDFEDPRGTYYTTSKIRVNLAEAYLASGNYPFAIREFATALPTLDTLKDNEGLLRAGIQLAEAYIRSGMFGTTDSLLEKLSPIATRIGNEELLSYIILNQGVSWSARLQNAKATGYYRKSYTMMVENKSPFILDCVNPYLAALNPDSDQEEALRIIYDENVKRALENSLPADRLEFKRVAIRFLCQQLSAAEINTYYQQLIQLEDSVNKEKQKRSAAEIQAKYQFEKQQEAEQLLLKENELLKQNAAYKRNQLVFITAVSMLLLVVLALFQQRLRQRTKTQEKELEFQRDRTGWMEREKAFRDQLIQQQRLMLARKISDTETLKTRLEELVKEKQEERRTAMLEQLEQLKNEKMSMEILMTQFNAIHPTFASSILKAYPKLSQADIQFCTLFRMSLNTKEISALLNVEPRSIYAKKYRIMEKMGLGEGDDFEKVVFGIG